MLADDFRRHEARRLIGDLIFGKIGRARRESRDHHLQQYVEALALERGNRDHFAEIVELAVFLDQRQQL